MKHDALYITAILKFIHDIERLNGDFESLDAALHDYRNYMAILRLLQIMSETTQRLSDTAKNQCPAIDWAAIAGFRNILVHDYLGDIDASIIRSIIHQELPLLHAQLSALGATS